MRTYGLSGSGMDIDQMVKDIMKAQRVKYDNLYKEKTQLEWQKTDYNAIYKTLNQFRNTIFDSRMQSNLAMRKVTSNNTAVTATATAGAAKISHTIAVSQLAAGVQRASSAAITTGESKENLVKQLGIQPNAFTVKLKNGEASADIVVDPNASIYELVNSINKANIGVTASYDATIDRFFLATTQTGAQAGLDFSGNSSLGLDFLQNKLKINTGSSVTAAGISSSAAIEADGGVPIGNAFSGLTGSFQLNIKNASQGTEANIQIDLTTDTLNTIAKKISSAAGVEAEAVYDPAARSFTIKAKTEGEVLDLSANTGLAAQFLTADLKLGDDVSGLGNISGEGVKSTAPIVEATDNIVLAELFEGLSGSFDLKLRNGENTETITIDTATDTLATLKAKIEGAAGINAQVSFDSTSGKLTIGVTDEGALSFAGSSEAGLGFLTKNLRLVNTVQITKENQAESTSAMFADLGDREISGQFDDMSGGSFVIRVKNGAGEVEEIGVDTSVNTLDELLGMFNAKFGAGTAEYLDGKVTLKAPDNDTFDFSGSDPAAIDFLTNKLNLNIISQKGQDAEVTLDGASFTQSSNVFTVSGVTYTLNNTTEAGKSASIVVTPDNDKTVEAVKKIVDEYNKVLELLNSEVNEAKYRDYLPLTDEEKGALTDDQIKAWEEKAKSGLLRRDPILTDLIYKMRNSFTDNISGMTGEYRNASSIGISTYLGDVSEGGKLYLDEEELRKALSADSDIVYKLFSVDGDSSAQDGVLTRIYDQLKSATDKLVDKAGTTASALYDTKSYLGKQLDDMEDRMEAMSKRLSAMETRYYKQFDAMEVALNQLSQQSSWLLQQFSNG